MKALRTRLTTGLAAMVLLAAVGSAAVVQGFIGGFSGGHTSGVRRPLHINGSVVCSNCRLDEVRQGQPQERGLYEFMHKNGQLVFKVTSVDDTSTFQSLAWPPRLWLRASDDLLSKLSAEENLFKPVGLTGILRPTRTLDVTEMLIQG